MFDNICSLPLSSDLISQAIHHKEPVFAVGLSSGHVQTFRLAGINDVAVNGQPENSTKTNKTAHTPKSNLKSNLRDSSSPTTSQNGLDTVDTVWRTRRHNGSCRALAFSVDGETLYSAGTDGIVKAASSETGRVTGKIRVPLDSASRESDSPSVIHALSPQALLLGTDAGYLRVYDLRASSTNSSTLIPTAKPQQSFRPHIDKNEGLTTSDPEPIVSLTALPPTAASTSGTCRTWITTSGSTLAACDLRKGVIRLSEDQGDLLLSSTFVPAKPGAAAKVVVGGAGGSLTLWNRGEWGHHGPRLTVHREQGPNDDPSIDAVCVVPSEVPSTLGKDVLAIGLGNGLIKFMSLGEYSGQHHGIVSHDDQHIEGVSTIGFDAEGRMISGGGPILKVWQEAIRDEPLEAFEEDEEDDSMSDRETAQEMVEEDPSDSEEDSDRPAKKKRKKTKRGKDKGRSTAHHGIAAFAGLD